MPSGSKKRKAAKKKKEQEATTNNNNASSSTNSSSNSNPLGNDDPKSQDERESDGGEDGSPASQDHHNRQHPFKEGSEESEKRDPSPVRSFDTEKSMEEGAHGTEAIEKVEIEDVGAIKSERELKSKEDSASQSISIKHIESVKESHDGSSSSSSSSSSSDDESQVAEKKYEEAAYVSILEATSQNGKNKPVDSCPEEVIHGTGKSSFGEADDSVVDIVTISDSVKPFVTATEEVISVTQIDSIESSSVPDVVETQLKGSEESKRNEEKVFPLSEDNVGAPSTVVESVANGNEGKVLPTSDAPIAETSHGAENVRDSKIPDSSENQPLVAHAPRAAERTSWMNCCGLLDLLTGSSR